MVYLVSYDLHNEKDYDSISAAIESYTAHRRILESVWIIGTNNKLTTVKNKLKKVIDENDDLIITEIVSYGGWLSKTHWRAIRKIFSEYGERS